MRRVCEAGRSDHERLLADLARDVFPREYGEDSGLLQGVGNVEAREAGVGVGAPQDEGVERPRKREVVHVLGLAPDEARVLQALDRTADEAGSSHLVVL